MALCINVARNRVLSATNAPPDNCQGYIALDSSEYQAMVQAYSVDPADIAEIWLWGFGSILIPWSIAYATKWVLKSIDMIGT